MHARLQTRFRWRCLQSLTGPFTLFLWWVAMGGAGVMEWLCALAWELRRDAGVQGGRWCDGGGAGVGERELSVWSGCDV